MPTATGSIVLTAQLVITPQQVHVSGWLTVQDERIVEVGTGPSRWPPHATQVRDLAAAPGGNVDTVAAVTCTPAEDRTP